MKKLLLFLGSFVCFYTFADTSNKIAEISIRLTHHTKDNKEVRSWSSPIIVTNNEGICNALYNGQDYNCQLTEINCEDKRSILIPELSQKKLMKMELGDIFDEIGTIRLNGSFEDENSTWAKFKNPRLFPVKEISIDGDEYNESLYFSGCGTGEAYLWQFERNKNKLTSKNSMYGMDRYIHTNTNDEYSIIVYTNFFK